MNEQRSGERFNIWGDFEKTRKNANAPVAGSDPLADEVPVDAALVHVVPMGETVAAAGPIDETSVNEDRRVEATPYEAPVGEPFPDESGRSKSIPYIAPAGETITHEAPIDTIVGSPAALVTREESERFRTRWNEIQGKFVDEPRAAVGQADALVSEVVEQITQMFANEHRALESQWKQGNDVSTEDLRQALQRYRSFFNRLMV